MHSMCKNKRKTATLKLMRNKLIHLLRFKEAFNDARLKSSSSFCAAIP